MKSPLHLVGLGFACAFAGGVSAQQSSTSPTPLIEVEGEAFYDWSDYLLSEKFQALGLRCGMPAVDPDAEDGQPPSDCSSSSTTIRPQYAPAGGLVQIPVVVHIIMSTSGQGAISDAQVASQIQILNEDFLALPGSNGAPGTDCQVQFYLATRDPNGNPTTGITRSTNNTWFNDGGGYYNTLAWDTNRYLNIYTNQASGALGYVPSLPQGGIVGSNADRVVILWSSFGLNGPIGPPYNKGRTVTHEVGHYFGLYHTFQNGCASVSGCYSNGDRICDTNPDGQPHFGCPNTSSCASVDPVHNYMEYTDDLCMWEFTPEQANRMRCTIQNWRPNLPRPPGGCSTATVTSRSAGNNLEVYTATPAVIGQNVTFTVDTQGWQFATIWGTSAPGERLLENGDWVLLGLESVSYFFLGPLAGPLATTQHLVAPDPSLCGVTVYSQAKLHNVARRPIRLTNTQDLRIGN